MCVVYDRVLINISSFFFSKNYQELVRDSKQISLYYVSKVLLLHQSSELSAHYRAIFHHELNAVHCCACSLLLVLLRVILLANKKTLFSLAKVSCRPVLQVGAVAGRQG